MKQFSKLFVPLMLFTLCACGSTNNNPTVDETSTSEEEEIVELTTEEVATGSYGGWFIDINVNRFLATDSSYNVSYSSNNVMDKSIRVTTSRPESLTVERIEGDNSNFIIHAHKAGDSVLCIYDAEDILVYRHVVRVRKKCNLDEIEKLVYNYDIYNVMFASLGQYHLTFGENPFQVTVSGSDEIETNMTVRSKLTFFQYNANMDAYGYRMEVIERDETSTTDLVECYISVTGDEVFVYYKETSTQENHLLNIFYPASLEYLRNL